MIGALLLNRSQISDTMLKLLPNHFYTVFGKNVYEAMCALFIDGSPVTPETIANYLQGRKVDGRSVLETIGGAKSIVGALEGIEETELDYWKGAVIKKAEERALLEFASECRRMALSDPADVASVRSMLEEKLISLSGGREGASVGIEQAADEFIPRMERYVNDPDGIIGYETGFGKLDRALDGLQPGNVTIIYAPSSRFKSLFATNIGWHLAEQNIPGLWFTTEMPRIQVFERILQLESGLNIRWLRRDGLLFKYGVEIESARKRLSHMPVYFCDTSSVDVGELRSEVSRHIRWHGIKYIIVDLVDHVSSSRYRDEMVNNQRVVMASMKQIAKDFNIHVMLVSHVTKGNQQTREKADLDVEEMIGSAAKYQDVDASISIGPVTYKMDERSGEMRLVAMSREDIISHMEKRSNMEVLLSITKNRHGELIRDIIELDLNQGGRFLDPTGGFMYNRLTYQDSLGILEEDG